MTIKLVVTDLDGTCLNSEKRVSVANRRAISALHERGIMVAIATGRMDKSIWSLARDLKIDLPLISSNGALVRDMHSGEIIFENPLPKPAYRKILDSCQQANAHWIVTCGNDFIVSAPDNPRLPAVEQWNSTLAPDERVDILTTDDPYTVINSDVTVYKLVVYSQTPQFLAGLAEDFSSIEGVAPVFTDHTLLDICGAGADKGRSVEILATKLGLTSDQVMTIGDQQNDMSMLSWAGLGIAMGNATDAVKAIADDVTSTNDQDGLALAIQKHLLS